MPNTHTHPNSILGRLVWSIIAAACKNFESARVNSQDVNHSKQGNTYRNGRSMRLSHENTCKHWGEKRKNGFMFSDEVFLVRSQAEGSDSGDLPWYPTCSLSSNLLCQCNGWCRSKQTHWNSRGRTRTQMFLSLEETSLDPALGQDPVHALWIWLHWQEGMGSTILHVQ